LPVITLFLLVFVLLWVVFYASGPMLQRLLRRTAHWTASFRYRDYLPVFVVLAIGLGATAVAGDAFLDLAESMREGSPELQRVDEEMHAWASSARGAGATPFFTALTILGTPVGLGILIVLAAIFVIVRGHWRWAVYLLVTTGVGGLLNLLLKSFFARARPELAEALRAAHGYSFPSGHAMGATITFGSLAYIGFRLVTRWRHRAAVLSLAWTFVLGIAASRVYLGVHWISDIAAGISAGLIWLATTTVGYETFRRIRHVRALRAKRDA
jgi:membrane-associated phospholipid phosphatase